MIAAYPIVTETTHAIQRTAETGSVHTVPLIIVLAALFVISVICLHLGRKERERIEDQQDRDNYWQDHR